MALKQAVPSIRVGVVGTGAISRHFILALERHPDMSLGRILTRRPLAEIADFPTAEALTTSIDQVIEHSDVVFECSGDALHAATTIGRVLDAGRPVVTLAAEFHITFGSAFVGRGLLSEAEGDQPGSLAALHEDALAMGFEPLAYGNMKGFLNLDPTPDEMRHWADKQGLSLSMVTSFTDGTKIQIEQCLVANGLGAGIVKEGLIAPQTTDLTEAAALFGGLADQLGHPISDFILGQGLPHGVFIVARHDARQASRLQYYKLGNGPFYVLQKDYCLVHLEVFKTIRRLMTTRRPLINNSATPRVSVAAVAKRTLRPGTTIARGCGSFDLRGICVNITDRPGHVPICLADDLRIQRQIEPGEMLTFDDVEVADTRAVELWRSIERRVLAGADPLQGAALA